MPIKPPNLDDRRYVDIVREARSLIPQYCPEWTNLGDSDPGMTLVQLFAWMTEMTIYRLNRVPDKTYIHFLNFIGEERREARASVVPLTFEIRSEGLDFTEIPAFTRCSTRQSEGVDALHFLTTQPLTVHDCNLKRVVAVHAGLRPTVREISFDAHPECAKGVLFGNGAGVQIFKMDAIEHGPRAYTPFQYLYLSHDDFRLMNFKPTDNAKIGRLRIRSGSSDNLPIGAMFKWEFYTGDLEIPWEPLEVEEEEEEVLGLTEVSLRANMFRLKELDHFGPESDAWPLPEAVKNEKFWVRGVVDYERWVAHRMQDDLEVTWRDDRGGEERAINNWEVRAVGRSLEFFLQDMPPIRGGWMVKFTMVDRSLPAGRNSYFPRYRWLYRRGESWEVIPADRVRYQGTSVILTGPLNDMAADGFNLRAERIETIFMRGIVPELEVELVWLRPVEISAAFGPDTGGAAPIQLFELPAAPFQPAPTLPPMMGMKFFIGSDLFENRAQKPVLVEIDVGFELDSQPIEETRVKELYHMQFTYRAADSWRVVYTPEQKYNQFTFADLDPDGAEEPGRRTIRLLLEPGKQLKGIHRAIISGKETTWIRFELTRASLTLQPSKKDPPLPVAVRIFGIRLGVDGVLGRDVFEQPMPGLKVSSVAYRDQNRRLTRTLTRAGGRLTEDYPFDRFIDIADDAGGSKDGAKQGTGHHAMYFELDKPLPTGNRHSVMFKCRGETYLPEGFAVDWEMLEQTGPGRMRWGRLNIVDDGAPFRMNKSGLLAFTYPDKKDIPPEGMWVRALFRSGEGTDETPALPPLSHLLLNTSEAVNLHAFRMEKFSGLGVPHQTLQLRRFPIFLHSEEGQSQFQNPEAFADIKLFVAEEDGGRREWKRAPGNSLLTASKDDRYFVVDTVDGTLTFGNGIRGKVLPVGNFNVTVEVYHTVPGEMGNVKAGAVAIAEGFNDQARVVNLLSATGGRNAESIEEIIRRAPSVLTSRDRAVTRLDFEIIAKEASGEVARAACDGRMSGDGEIGIVILPQRREGEKIPDTFLSAGLKEHVQRYLHKRCLVNTNPVVRLATFQELDVSVTLRLRPNTNSMIVREKARWWIDNFLDPYNGGLDGTGWPFSGTLWAQDFGRLVSDIGEVRHVGDVQLFEIGDGRDKTVPGWEMGQGVSSLVLGKRDLFVLRKVRVKFDEDEA
jgi:hypothetical protein